MNEQLLRLQDDDGTEWEIREISDPTLAVMPARLLRHPEFAAGWLLFESVNDKRRLAPYPPNWRELDRSALLEFVRLARPSTPPRPRDKWEPRPPDPS